MQEKRKDQYERSAKTFAFSIVSLFMIIVFMLVFKECKSVTKDTAWLMCISNQNKITCKTLMDEAAVYRVLSCYFPGIDLPAITKSLFFEIRTENLTIYIERKRPHITKNGKVKLRKWRKK